MLEGVTVTLFKIIVPYIKIIQRIIIFFLKNEGNFYYVLFRRPANFRGRLILQGVKDRQSVLKWVKVRQS